MTLKIGNYTIESNDVYQVLFNTGITSNKELKAIDKNKDNSISENELTELVLEDDEDDTKTTSTKKATNSSSSKTSTKDYQKSIQMYEKKISNLLNSLTSICNSLCSSNTSMDTFDSQLSSLDNILKSLKSSREAICELLEEQDEAIGKTSSTNSTTKTTSTGASTKVNKTSSINSSNPVNTLNSVNSQSSLKSGSGTAENISQFGLQYDGYSQDTMKSIMESKGYQFDWGQWCADFVTFCTGETYGMEVLEGNTAPSCCCSGYADWAKRNNILMDARRDGSMDLTKVKPGDYVLYNDNGNYQYPYYHIGVVTAVHPESGTVDTIEGNTNGGNCGSHSGVSASNLSFILVHNLIDKNS